MQANKPCNKTSTVIYTMHGWNHELPKGVKLWRSGNNSKPLMSHSQETIISHSMIKFNVKYSSDLWPYRTPTGFVIFQTSLLKSKDIWCEKMHMASILVRYGCRWHSDKPYLTRLWLVRYDLSECYLNPYRARMDTICISTRTLLWSRKVMNSSGINPYRTNLKSSYSISGNYTKW